MKAAQFQPRGKNAKQPMSKLRELSERTLQLAKYLYAWKRVQRPRRRFSHAVSVRASRIVAAAVELVYIAINLPNRISPNTLGTYLL